VKSGGSGVASALGLLLLLGACGKSAQVPLQSWLLDAMEGPTPVSALIHAATMVTAGVYLIVRSNPIFNLAPTAQLAVTVVGAVTLLFGAIIGCAKDDIKKALAGSTMSQIGYMTLAAGLGPAGYVFAIAHLLAHGFFKAGLFLGAGSVMHGMDDEVNMRRFGALRKLLPITFVTFGLGYLAIIGIPPFSGFFTKDGIIDAAWDKGGTSGYILAACAILGAGITAFYMTRLMLMTWFGSARWKEQGVLGGAGAHPAGAEPHIPHPHESPLVMTVPMILLAVGSVVAGWFLIVDSRFSNFLSPVVGSPPDSHGIWSTPGIIALALALGGIGTAWVMYGRVPVAAVAPRGSVLAQAARADLYGDAFNESVLMRPGQWLTRLSVFFDGRGVDGLVNGLAATIGGTSGRMRRIRALLRAVHAYRRRAACGRPTGGEALNDPCCGTGEQRDTLADRRGRHPAARRDRGGPAARPACQDDRAAVLAGRPGLGDRHGHPVQHLGAELPVHRGVLLDPAVRRALRARRGRDRAGAHRHDRRADARGRAGLLA
jgi:NADH-quinone oxidoreductase subunit L